MANDAKEKTARIASVGADERQSIQKSTVNSMPISEPEINDEIENSEETLEELYRRMQRMTDPHYLHTISMTELYQPPYRSRPPYY